MSAEVRLVRYLRFVVERHDDESGFRQGFVQAAAELQSRGDIPQREVDRLEHIFGWFKQNLVVPTRFGRKRNAAHKNSRGLSWFKDTAKEHIGRAREIAEILEAYGCPVRMIVTDRPGYIVYEDEHQVVAEPFSETGT
ncbi:MAG: hypothetical protein PVI30_03195 [Myxococcales bacterium]|jgi:hypothetical protein